MSRSREALRIALVRHKYCVLAAAAALSLLLKSPTALPGSGGRQHPRFIENDAEGPRG